MQLSTQNREGSIRVERDSSIAVLVARDHTTPPFVLEVYADTQAGARRYLGALTVDAGDLVSSLARPALVVGSAWVPGAIGYTVRLAQASAAAAPVVDLAAGPPLGTPGVIPHGPDAIQVSGPAYLDTIQLADTGPRALVSAAAYLRRTTPAGSYAVLLFDRAATDPVIAPGTAPDFPPIPIAVGQLAPIAPAPLASLRFARGLRAHVSADEVLAAMPAGGPWAQWYAQTRA